ncbi:hypothetical protein [Halomarina pelagica]|uniref:hypothetical protein n=1 Tax=Halomarina pelagica TaxID=2961599 RepID=UPI0020C2D18F|nr:hypothetical protein [Halomarina sp. BND7]
MTAKDPSGPGRWLNDERAVRRREDSDGIGRLLTGIGYYGLGQLCLLAWPMIYLIYQAPLAFVEAKAAAAVSFGLVPFLVGLFRGRYVAVGRPWPALTANTLGTDAGYGAYLTRSVYLSCTLGLATYAGTAVHVLAGSWVLNVLVAAGITVGGIALLPYLSTGSTEARVARGGYYALSLAVVAVGAAPLDTSVGDPILGPALFALLVGLALLDLRPLPGTGDGRTP